jgi:hypothetical protein
MDRQLWRRFQLQKEAGSRSSKFRPSDLPSQGFWLDAHPDFLSTTFSDPDYLVDSWTDRFTGEVFAGSGAARPKYVSEGINGHHAIQFDGSDYLEVVSFAGADLVDLWTIGMVWRLPTETGTTQFFSNLRIGAPWEGYRYQYDGTGEYPSIRKLGSGYASYALDSATYDDDAPHSSIMVKTGTTTFDFYVDGVKTTSGGTITDFNTEQAGYTVIGGSRSTGPTTVGTYTGYISDIVVYKDAKSGQALNDLALYLDGRALG